jgi:hypothetical protein
MIRDDYGAALTLQYFRNLRIFMITEM